MAKIPQIKKPIKIGSVVFLTNPPINIAIGTAITVETKPFIAEPTPAMCPIGSIAKDRIFPKRNPIEKNCSAKKASKISIVGLSLP